MERLSRGLWHSTSLGRYRRILGSGAILPEPDIPDQDRWKTGKGVELYPLVRRLGGVSLFELGSVDLERYSKTHPFCSWHQFIPFRKDWGCSVWIQVDVDAANLIAADELANLWEVKNFHRHTLMPRIEAAHLGPIPVTAFVQVLSVSAEGWEPLPKQSLMAVLSRLDAMPEEVLMVADLPADAVDL